ncbi:MAG: hypothetical protein HOP08_01010 [Cyclobacteriaceae bacterium]|nr:hypothetical protein [Cyclobacteriaceae bacterium]
MAHKSKVPENGKWYYMKDTRCD